MNKPNKTEVWLRGTVPNIPALLQPVAHALLQAREEIEEMLIDFSEGHLWEQPAGVASVGFHLQHLEGVLDRLLTYAKGETLSREQQEHLSLEGKPLQEKDQLQRLVAAFSKQVDATLRQLSATDEDILKEPRGVGRAKLPSTVLGLLVHAAEHTMRHVGQLLVTVRIIKDRA